MRSCFAVLATLAIAVCAPPAWAGRMLPEVPLLERLAAGDVMPEAFRRATLTAAQREALAQLARAHRDDDVAALCAAVAGPDPVLRLVALRALPYSRLSGGWVGSPQAWPSPRGADVGRIAAVIPAAAKLLTEKDEATAQGARQLLVQLANQPVAQQAAARAYEVLVRDAAATGGIQPVQALVLTRAQHPTLDARARDAVRAEVLRILDEGRPVWNVEHLVDMLAEQAVVDRIRGRYRPGGGFFWLAILAQARHPDAPALILGELAAGLGRRDLAMHAAAAMPAVEQLPYVEAILQDVAPADAIVPLRVLRGVGGPEAAQVAQRFFDRAAASARDAEGTLLHEAARVVLHLNPPAAPRLARIARGLPPQRAQAVTAALAEAGGAISLPKLAGDLARSLAPTTDPRFGATALGWAYRHAPDGPARALLVKRLEAVAPRRAPKVWAVRFFESAPAALLVAIRDRAPGTDEAVEARLLDWLATAPADNPLARRLLAQALGAVGGARTIAALAPRCRFPERSGVAPLERLWMREAVGTIASRLR